MAIYLVMIIIGLVAPLAAVFGYFAVAVFFIVPFRFGRTHSRIGRPDTAD